MKSAQQNRVRIIGGQWRRRLLNFPDAEGLRPTADAVREKLFNWLGQDLQGWCCLDLFAGSGALGFEAASRGAARVVMVENNRAVYTTLRASLTALGANNIILECGDGVKLISQPEWVLMQPRFDLVFIDPPFASGLQASVLTGLLPLLNPEAYVYVEHDGSFKLPAGWRVWREGRAGRAYFMLLQQD